MTKAQQDVFVRLPNNLAFLKRPALLYQFPSGGSSLREKFIPRLSQDSRADLAMVAQQLAPLYSEYSKWSEACEDEHFVGYKRFLYLLEQLLAEMFSGFASRSAQGTGRERPPSQVPSWTRWPFSTEQAELISKYGWVHGDNHIDKELATMPEADFGKVTALLRYLETREAFIEELRKRTKSSPEAGLVDRFWRFAQVLSDMQRAGTLQDLRDEWTEPGEIVRTEVPPPSFSGPPARMEIEFTPDGLPDPIDHFDRLVDLCQARSTDRLVRKDALRLLLRCRSEDRTEAVRLLDAYRRLVQSWDWEVPYVELDWFVTEALRHARAWVPLEKAKLVASIEASVKRKETLALNALGELVDALL